MRNQFSLFAAILLFLHANTTDAASLRVIAPASYIAEKPFLVRVDLLNAQGELDRRTWDKTVELTTDVPEVVLPAVQLYNGMGSALVTLGATQPKVFFAYGSGGNGTQGANSGSPGALWKYKTDITTMTVIPSEWKDAGFDDSAWSAAPTQIGYGDADENFGVPQQDYDSSAPGIQSAPAYLFRNTFSITDLTKFTSFTGEVKYDDGVVIYVNGAQVLRTANLSPSATLSDYADFGGAPTVENATAPFSIPLNLLHNGVNTIAVELHQHDSGSGDITFDLKLQGNFIPGFPGNVVLTANAGGLATSRAISTLGALPAMSNVSGTLPTGTTTWSGVVHVTGDVTVPVGGTLNISAGTHILVDGDATPGSTAGKRVIVNGTLHSQGTSAAPVSISSFNSGDRWGQIYFNNAQPSSLQYTLLNHAGHTTGSGHTGSGPMLQMVASSLNIQDCVIADGPAKALYTSAVSDLVIQRTLIERMITGPEVEDGCAVLIEDSNIQRTLPDYRESHSSAPDDEDCLYVHNSSTRSVILRRSVLARCGDDAFDCLAGPITVEDCVIREAWDKGISLLNNSMNISRSLIVDCDKAIVPKGTAATTYNIQIDRCTIVSEDHNTALSPWGYGVPPGGGDPDSPSTGIYTQNKVGQSNPAAVLAINVSNCVILAKEPVKVDAMYPASNTVVKYSNTFDVDNPAAPPWSGTGNVASDPVFVDANAGDFRICVNSPAHNTGDPLAALDADGSRADMGALPFGGAPPNAFSAWSAYFAAGTPVSDLDGDGIAAVTEFALGMNPMSGLGVDGFSGLPDGTLGAGARMEMNLSLPVNNAAAQSHGQSQITYRVWVSNALPSWEILATKTQGTAWTGTGSVIVGTPVNGFVPVTARDVTGTFTKRFMRLETILTP